MNTDIKINFAFFGSSIFSIIVLDELKRLGYIPKCIVTTPDKPQGRKLIMTENVVKGWSTENKIKVYSPTKIDSNFIEDLKKDNCIVFVVASYGKILPKSLIELPTCKSLNIHPSLLPKYRGATPLQSAILDDEKNTGVTIIRIDEKMDSGPIVAKKEITISEWPTYNDFEVSMAKVGAQLLAEILPGWVTGKITEQAQDDAIATYTRKITKEDGLIDLGSDPYQNFLKIQAYHEWPVGYFFIDHTGKKTRVKITSASFVDGNLVIEKVIPEGNKEMSYRDFQSGYQKN